MARDARWNDVENNLPNAKQQVSQWQVINTTTWKASDNLTIKNIASYAELKALQTVDLFGARFLIGPTLPFYSSASNTTSQVDLTALGLSSFIGKSFIFVPVNSLPNRYSNEQSTMTEELQFQGNANEGRLQWQAGFYFEKSNPLGFSGNLTPTFLGCTDIGTFQCTDYIAAILRARGAPATTVVGSMNLQSTQTTFRNIGLYAQASYDLTDKLKLTAGFRYTWDKTTTVADRVTYRFFTPNTPVGFCSNPVLRPASSPLPDPSATELCRVPQATVPTFNFTGQQISKAPTWLIDLDYKPIEDILLYAKWARGYRQGATQPFGPDGLPPFRQEKVDTYEVGLKSSFRGAVSGTFNVAAFYNNFVDQQISASYSVPLLVGVAPNAGVVNAPKSRIYGLEAELVLVPFEGFRIQGAYAYLNSTIKTLDPLPDLPSFVPGSPRQLAIIGAPLPYTPKHKFSIDASYRLPLDESIGEIVLGTTYSYTGKQFYQGPSSTAAAAFLGAYGTNEVYDIKSYGLWTLNASWNRVAGSPVDASFFMTNVANKHYYLARNLQPTSGFVSRYLAEPRMWGFKLRYNFGS